MTAPDSHDIPEQTRQAVFKKGVDVLDTRLMSVKGFDLNEALYEPHLLSVARLMQSYETMGFQATNLHQAMSICHEMLIKRKQSRTNHLGHPSSYSTAEGFFKIFFGFTSNQISCGNRELIRFMVQHHLVDCLVTTAGGIEEDLIKCLRPTILKGHTRSFDDDVQLRTHGLNRIGNLLVPNGNYCAFEDWLSPLLDKMHSEQITEGVKWTPSRMIRRLGKEINNEESILYWAAKHGVPVFCPALTDGSLGDMLFFHTYRKSDPSPLQLDIILDLREINQLAMKASDTGMLILGGGLVKHHIANANLMRNGASYGVFINTGHEWDGSDAGAHPSEAVSWGKLRAEAQMIKVTCDASLVFPLLVSSVFLPEAKRQIDESRRDLLDTLYI